MHNNKKKLILGVHYLRGIAALGVVLYHSGDIIAFPKYQHNETFDLFAGAFETGVDLFFIISGFVVTLPFFNKKKLDIRFFALSRISRIYPLVIVTALIFSLSGVFVMGYDFDINNLLTSAFLIPSPQTPSPVVLWTLKQEILFYLLFSLVFWNARIGFMLLIAWGISSFLITNENWLWEWFFHTKNIEFLFGIGACAAYSQLKPPPNQTTALMLVSTSICFLAASYYNWTQYQQGELLKVMALSVSGSILIYSIAVMNFKKNKFFSLIGTSSYSIYLIHIFFLSLLNKIFITLGVPDYVTFVSIFLISSAAGIVYYLLLEKPIETFRKSIISKSL